MADTYACCEHCEHSPDMLPDQHPMPCPHGCNDPRTSEFSSLQRKGGSDNA